MSALVKNNLRCMVLNILEPLHLITVDVNEQRIAVVQPTENKRTQAEQWLSSSGDGGWSYSSDLEIC